MTTLSAPAETTTREHDEIVQMFEEHLHEIERDATIRNRLLTASLRNTEVARTYQGLAMIDLTEPSEVHT